MKILGLCTMGNSAACIVINGFVISAIEEERLSRIKNDGGFPLKAIKRCMSDKKISFKEIDAIAVYGSRGEYYKSIGIKNFRKSILY